MNLIDFLRKIGVLRYGTKKYKYTSGRDMPPEALMNDVYDAKKDLVTGEDVQAVKSALRGDRSQLFKWAGIFAAVLMVLAGIGLLFSPSDKKNSVQGGQAETVSPGAPGKEQTPSVAVEINAVLAKLRQANLDENIDEFMKYYGDTFPDRAGKRQTTLANWKQYDYESLEFFVFDLSVDRGRAKASVGWEIALLEKGKNEPQIIETTNEVVLEKGRQGWQIIALQ